MSPERESLIGSVLDGRYRIDSLLGEGGMGAVYSATDLRLDKPVAVKVMSRDLAANADALARFHREARVTSGLGHPHIVHVSDSSTTPAGEPFLVMEFLAGEDLDRRLRRQGRLTPPQTIHIIKQVASALLATHEKDIVHRDLKPANIYLLRAAGEDDFVKVLDFGISKMASAATKLTRSRAIVGTPNYMSPEQAEGKNEDIDTRTDQWALACIAWECLAGEMLFDGDSATAVLLQIVNKPPRSLLAKVPDLHPAIEEVLLRALARNKSDRFANVNEFAVALEGAITGSPALPSTSPTVQVGRTAVDVEASKGSVPPSTFAKTAGELGGQTEASGTRSKAWIWGLAVGAAVLLLVGAFLLMRPTAPAKPTAVRPAPAAPVAPVPVPVPPPLAAPPAPPVETEIAPPQPQPVPTAVPQTKRARRTREPKTEAPAPVREPAQELPPPSSKESQDKWRLD